MRVSREQAKRHRARIVDVASRLFREKGFEGVGVDSIMDEAGLTHGGFYGHFESKADLATEAIELALQRSFGRQNGLKDLRSLADWYLSEAHRLDRADGCAVAALAPEIARKSKGVRRALTAYLRLQANFLEALLRRGTRKTRRRRAITAFSAMVGALMMARAVDDRALAREIMKSVREELGTWS